MRSTQLVHPTRSRIIIAGMLAVAVGMLAPLSTHATAGAAIVPTVPLATSAQYSVMGGQTVTNTGPSVLAESIGLSPGTSVVGFAQPGGPGTVLPPGVINIANGPAGQAQLDLTAAYDNAAGRPINATTTSELGGLILGPGVYSGPSKSPLQITGPLVLDGQGDPNAVFIFQTYSTLVTASSSTVSVVNGASECNVFWQVLSSATLGTGSVFTGNIMALQSITVNTGVTVHGRALARNGATTLDNDVFTSPSCVPSSAPSPRTTPTGSPSETPSGTPSQVVPPTGAAPPTTTTPRPRTPGVPPVSGPPRTGAAPLAAPTPWLPLVFGGLLGTAGVAAMAGIVLIRRTS